MYRAIPKNSGLCQRRMTSDAQLLGILFVLGNMTFSINLWFAKRSLIMPKSGKQNATQSEALRGWQRISAFLDEPVSVVQRWASEGMHVHREGRFVATSPAELNAWLGEESAKPVHAAAETTGP